MRACSWCLCFEETPDQQPAGEVNPVGATRCRESYTGHRLIHVPAIGSSAPGDAAQPPGRTGADGGEAGGAADSGVVSGGGAGGWNSWRLTRRRNT